MTLPIGVLRSRLRSGLVIPAHPLALTRARRLDERRQRALTRYYLAAGSGGIAVGVHTTQFGIRDPNVGLYRPVLALAADTLHAARRPAVAIAGVIGPTAQAVREATLAADLGYDAVLLSLGGLDTWSDQRLATHAAAVAEVLPLIGFYLQPAAGGRVLGPEFWRAFLAIERVVAIKVAPFDRYRTLDVVRAVVETGRAHEVALYTGNDDQIVLDLLTPFRIGNAPPVRIAGGLLGQWAVWTRSAVLLHRAIRRHRGKRIPSRWLTLAAQITEANAAIFDAAHRFAGCLPGIHEILRGQGLLQGTWCLDPAEVLSPGQRAAIDRVRRLYPRLADDRFVARHRERWLV